MDDTTKGLDRSVEVQIYVGKSEIQINAYNLDNNDEYTTIFNINEDTTFYKPRTKYHM
jgi:hypothetical protein